MDEGWPEPPYDNATDNHHNHHNPTLPLPLPLPPCRHHHHHHTYIVQVPKDQVYRVPPPENAAFVEQQQQRLNPINNSRNKHTNTCICTSLISLSILITIALIITSLYFIFKPNLPDFSVDKFDVTNPPPTSKKKVDSHWVPNYLVTIRVKNPSARSGLSYVKGGDVTMYYDDVAVAAGEFPGLDQGPGDSAAVRIELLGSKDQLLDADMRRSMNATSKRHVAISFELEMNLEVKGKIGVMKIYGMNPNVNCKVKLSSLLKDDARVLSQECKSN